MHSKNKAPRTAAEDAYIATIKAMACIVCGSKPCDAHEIEQGLWWLSLPLCKECHQGTHGIHGDKAIWKAAKKTEHTCLNEVNRMLHTGDNVAVFAPTKKPHKAKGPKVRAPMTKIFPRPY